MSEIKHDTHELAISSLENYSVVEIMHHIVGNELATISGYTQLLLRGATAQEQESSLLVVGSSASRYEKWVPYLRAMKQSEDELNDFLVQLRDCSLATTKRSFHEHLAKTDLVSLLKQIIEKLAPLYQHRTVQMHLPAQPLSVRCNRLWITLALEHIIKNALADHTTSTPVIIGVEEDADHSTKLQKARIVIHVTRGSMELQSGTGEIFEMRLQARDEKDRDICTALSSGIFREHGGRLWSEQGAEQRKVVYVELPLVK